MKQKQHNRAMKLVTQCGKNLAIDSNGKIWDGDLLVGREHMSVALLRSLKVGGKITIGNEELEIAEITQQFREGYEQKLGKCEKKTELNDDKLFGWVLTAFPSLRVGLAEMQNSTVTEWLQQLPIPVLKEMFESAPPEVQVLLVPALVALGCMVAGTLITGHAINKGKVAVRKAQLLHRFVGNTCVKPESVMTKFKQQRKHNAVGQAYRNVIEDTTFKCGKACSKAC